MIDDELEPDDEQEKLERWYEQLKRQRHSVPGYSPDPQPPEHWEHARD